MTSFSYLSYQLKIRHSWQLKIRFSWHFMTNMRSTSSLNSYILICQRLHFFVKSKKNSSTWQQFWYQPQNKSCKSHIVATFAIFETIFYDLYSLPNFSFLIASETRDPWDHFVILARSVRIYRNIEQNR